MSSRLLSNRVGYEGPSFLHAHTQTHAHTHSLSYALIVKSTILPLCLALPHMLNISYAPSLLKINLKVDAPSGLAFHLITHILPK